MANNLSGYEKQNRLLAPLIDKYFGGKKKDEDDLEKGADDLKKKKKKKQQLDEEEDSSSYTQEDDFKVLEEKENLKKGDDVKPLEAMEATMEEEALNALWEEQALALRKLEEDSEDFGKRKREISPSGSCKHRTVFNEEIGIFCKDCGEVLTEIRYISERVKPMG